MLGLRTRSPRQATKLDLVRYSDRVSLGSSPTLRDMKRLARKAGIQALLNLNTEGEPGQLLSPNVEASWAHALDLQHERVSIDVGGPQQGWVERFQETLLGIRKPVYVHSLHGRRAAMVMILHLALERGLSAERALAESETLGIDCDLGHLRPFLLAEIDERALADPLRRDRAHP